MASIILVCSDEMAKSFIEDYAKRQNIPSYNIQNVEGAKIENVREITRKLSFKSNSNRLFVFTGKSTIEAQNALLKSVEEHQASTHFVFLVEKEDMLLATIRSRCRMVRLENAEKTSTEIESILTRIFSVTVPNWAAFDELSTRVSELGINVLLSSMRNFMLCNLHDKGVLIAFYPAYKRLLMTIPLVENNNVSPRTLIEKAFINNIGNER